jgi:hypothetical protein
MSRRRITATRPRLCLLLLAAGALECRAPTPEIPPHRVPLTEQRAPRNKRPAPGDAPVAPPPEHGHRLATREATSTAPQLPFRQREPEAPTCVASWPEVRFRNYGYDHLVHLQSRCALRAFCDVASDVNPKPTRVVIRPREELEVLTFRGSPARQFTPKVECRFRTRT